MSTMQVVEGIEGRWRYHLAPDGRHWEALCGARTMITPLRLEHWKKLHNADHMPREKWCEKCEQARGAEETKA